MDSFKGFYVSAFITVMLLIFAFCAYQYIKQPSDWIWLGNVLSYGTGVVYFAGIFLVATPRTTQNMWSTWVPIFIGSAMVFYGFVSGFPSALPFVFSIIMLLGWYLYTFWATDFSIRDKEFLKVGGLMPNLLLKDAEGLEIPLSSFFHAPAIFLFYRGNWCPFCMAQIKELAKEYQQIEAAGASLVFISPQSVKHNKHLSKKFDIPAHFLIDEDLKAAKALKLFHKNGTPRGMEVLGFDSDNVLPTLLITDSEGILRFVDLTDNYRLRPEPSVYLKLLGEF